MQTHTHAHTYKRNNKLLVDIGVVTNGRKLIKGKKEEAEAEAEQKSIMAIVFYAGVYDDKVYVYAGRVAGWQDEQRIA